MLGFELWAAESGSKYANHCAMLPLTSCSFVPGFYDIIAIVAGCVQTILYCDFFYLYITKVLKGKKLQLPA